MKYNRPHSTAAWGMMAKDWEQGVDYSRLSKDRLKRAQMRSAMPASAPCWCSTSTTSAT